MKLYSEILDLYFKHIRAAKLIEELNEEIKRLEEECEKEKKEG